MQMSASSSIEKLYMQCLYLCVLLRNSRRRQLTVSTLSLKWLDSSLSKALLTLSYHSFIYTLKPPLQTIGISGIVQLCLQHKELSILRNDPSANQMLHITSLISLFISMLFVCFKKSTNLNQKRYIIILCSITNAAKFFHDTLSVSVIQRVKHSPTQRIIMYLSRKKPLR